MTPPIEFALQMLAANMSLMRDMLRALPQVTAAPAGEELLNALDAARMSAERLRLELALEHGDLSFEDETSAGGDR